MGQNPGGVAANMLGGCSLTTAGNSKRSFRGNLQNKPELVLELFGEPAAHQSVENRTNRACALWLRQPAVLETSRHLRPCSAMPEAHRLRFNERNALLDRLRIICEQAIGQGDQLSLVEQLEVVGLGLHRDNGKLRQRKAGLLAADNTGAPIETNTQTAMARPVHWSDLLRSGVQCFYHGLPEP